MNLYFLDKEINTVEITCRFTKFLFQDSDYIDVVENGVSNQVRFNFASFQFLHQDNKELFGHCNVHICDGSSASDCVPNCSGRKR